MEVTQTMAGELEKAREMYWSILYQRDYLKLLEESLRANTESLATANRRIRSGVATEADRVEFEMAEIDLRRESEKAELELANLKRSLAVVLGIEPGAALEFPEELAHEHEWESMIRHSEKDHEFLVKPKELAAAEARTLAQIEGRAWIPKVDAYAGIHQFNQREEDPPAAADRRESVLGIRLSLNLFGGITSHREAGALSAEAAAATAEAEYAKREIDASLHGEMSQLKLLHAQVHAAEANILRAEKYQRLTLSEYARGVKNSPDVLGAREKLTAMKEKRIGIIRDFQISKSRVLSRLGR
jgi:outer membrane protein TolC